MIVALILLIIGALFIAVTTSVPLVTWMMAWLIVYALSKILAVHLTDTYLTPKTVDYDATGVCANTDEDDWEIQAVAHGLIDSED